MFNGINLRPLYSESEHIASEAVGTRSSRTRKLSQNPFRQLPMFGQPPDYSCHRHRRDRSMDS